CAPSAGEAAGGGDVGAEGVDAPALEADHVGREVLVGGEGRQRAGPGDETSLSGERPAVDRVVDSVAHPHIGEQGAARVQGEEAQSEAWVDEVALPTFGRDGSAGS